MDRLLTTYQAGQMLGGMHPKDVCVLIRTGRLRAKKDVVRPGKTNRRRPHYKVLLSELQRYMRELPDAIEPEPEPARRPRRPKMAGVIQFMA